MENSNTSKGAMGKSVKKPKAKSSKTIPTAVIDSTSVWQTKMMEKEISLLDDITDAMHEESLYKIACAQLDASGVKEIESYMIVDVTDEQVEINDQIFQQWKSLKNLNSAQIYSPIISKPYMGTSITENPFSYAQEGPAYKCPCGDPNCSDRPLVDSWVLQSGKKPLFKKVPKVDDPFEQFSKKDLIGAIRSLLEDAGATGINIPQAGAKYLQNDIIITNDSKLPYVAFRSLVDAREESE